MSLVKRSTKQDSAVPGTVERTLGYPQCEYRSDAARCQYPGTISNCLRGEGPFYCSGHFGCSSPRLGADIVMASMNYVHKLPGTPRYDKAQLREPDREPGEDVEEQSA